MDDCMDFPKSFEEFVKEYSFRDSDEVYTNGSELILTFRVMQGYSHFANQLRANAIDEIITLIENGYTERNLYDYFKSEQLRGEQK